MDHIADVNCLAGQDVKAEYTVGNLI